MAASVFGRHVITKLYHAQLIMALCIKPFLTILSIYNNYFHELIYNFR